jgi:arylsulfatase A-like enzyme
VENHAVVGLNPADPIEVSYAKPFPGEPLGTTHRDTLRLDWSPGHNMAVVNGVGRIGHMKGGRAARWRDEDMADTFAAKGVKFIEENRARPFFLYFATHGIHVPRVPHPRFVGATTMGARGDAIAEFDDTVGQVLGALEKFGLAKNTIVILTSDNGPVLDDGYKDDANEKLGAHKPAGPWRGGKYSLYEAGTRVPFLVRWPGHVAAGTTSDAIVSQVDFVATFAALAGRPHPGATARDSRDQRAALLGNAPAGRDHVLEHAGAVSVRVGGWKFIPPAKGPAKNAGNESGKTDAPQLYDLATDPGEQRNLAADPAHAARIAELSAVLAREKARTAAEK